MSDLYTEWLELPPGDRPPDHYALLGLPAFTPTVPEIEHAARLQFDKLDKYAVHPDKAKREACGQMMNQVAVARVTLCNPERRKAYDAALAKARGLADPPHPGGSADSDDDLFEPNFGDDAAAAGDDPSDIHGDLLAAPTAVQAEVEARTSLDSQSTGTPGRPIHWSVVGPLAGLGVAALVTVIMMLVMFMGQGSQPQPPRPSSSSAVVTPSGASATGRAATAAAPSSVGTGSADATPSVGAATDLPLRPTFEDFFDRDAPGPIYASNARDGATLIVQDGSLTLSSTNEVDASLRITPSQESARVVKVALRLRMEPGSTVQIAPQRGASLLLERRQDLIHTRLPTGRPDGPQWPSFPAGRWINVTAEIGSGHAIWSVDDVVVGRSPDMAHPDTPPSLDIRVAGPEGVRLRLQRVSVWY